MEEMMKRRSDLFYERVELIIRIQAIEEELPVLDARISQLRYEENKRSDDK